MKIGQRHRECPCVALAIDCQTLQIAIGRNMQKLRMNYGALVPHDHERLGFCLPPLRGIGAALHDPILALISALSLHVLLLRLELQMLCGASL